MNRPFGQHTEATLGQNAMWNPGINSIKQPQAHFFAIIGGAHKF